MSELKPDTDYLYECNTVGGKQVFCRVRPVFPLDIILSAQGVVIEVLEIISHNYAHKPRIGVGDRYGVPMRELSFYGTARGLAAALKRLESNPNGDVKLLLRAFNMVVGVAEHTDDADMQPIYTMKLDCLWTNDGLIASLDAAMANEDAPEGAEFQ